MYLFCQAYTKTNIDAMCSTDMVSCVHGFGRELYVINAGQLSNATPVVRQVNIWSETVRLCTICACNYSHTRKMRNPKGTVQKHPFQYLYTEWNRAIPRQRGLFLPFMIAVMQPKRSEFQLLNSSPYCKGLVRCKIILPIFNTPMLPSLNGLAGNAVFSPFSLAETCEVYSLFRFVYGIFILY